jgi:hypothetical protein
MQALRIPSASKIPDQFEEAKIISAAGPAVQEHFRRDDPFARPAASRLG